METKDIPENGPTDWRREPSERRNAVIGKLSEESSELAGRCARAMIQGLDALDPDTGRSNLAHLQDEIADVQAMTQLAIEFLRLDTAYLQDRRIRKYRYKKPWVAALPCSQASGGSDVER